VSIKSSPASKCAAAAAAGGADNMICFATKSMVEQDQDMILKQIFVRDIPLLDVRAEGEFAKGAFPTSVNIPILNDEQRHLVGCCYKERGPEAAYQLGVQLVGPVKDERVKAWKDFAQSNPSGYVYCFRGGSRSQISQGSLKEAGIDYPLVPGGYKRMRQFLIDELERIQDLPIIMIGGRTGSGKTRLLKQFATHVDLEGLANHRGSAFGALIQPQPSQINFENQLAIEFLKLQQSDQRPIFIEEEGRRIGQMTLPLNMHTAMLEKYPVIEMELSMNDRVQICMQDYVTELFPLFQAEYGNSAAPEAFRRVHLNNLGRIKKRVPHYEIVHQQVTRALDMFLESGNESGFCEPIEAMLHYYDKMYDYQADNRKGEVLFRGDSQAILEWARSPEGHRKLAEV